MERKFKLGLVSLKKGDNCAPAGLVYIATYLQQHLKDDFEVKIIEQNYVDVEKKLKEGKFDLIGISAMTVHYGAALRLSRWIKQNMPAPVVIGGVHISTLPGSFENCFDIGVIGEGEASMLEIVRAYLGKKAVGKEELLKIKGLIFFDGGHLVTTEERPLIEDLDSIPLPDWRLVQRTI